MRVLAQAMWIATFGAVLGFVLHAVRSDGVALLRPFSPEMGGAAECSVASGPSRVDVVDAERLQRAHQAVFGDVRNADEYAAGHVVDAVHLPCSADAPQWLGNVDKSTTVVIYGAGDADAGQVAQSLTASGYEDVRVLQGGFPAWRDAGGSAASGPCEICD